MSYPNPRGIVGFHGESPPPQVKRRSAVVFGIVAFLIGGLMGLFTVEHLAPRYPNFFCRPSGGGGPCEAYPWK
jgi:hypothetical protein